MGWDGYDAGTVVGFEFSALGGEFAAMRGFHPAVVVSPRAAQRGGTAILVPLSSKVWGNEADRNVVEITHHALADASPSGRTFAICDKPAAVRLDHPSLDHFETDFAPGANRGRRHRIVGPTLRAVRIAVMSQLMPDAEFRKLLTEDNAADLNRLRDRVRAAAAAGARKKRRPPRRRR